MQLGIKFDLRAPTFGAPPSQLYAAAIEQCSWADEIGFDVVRFLEHHGTDDGYCTSPLIMAAAAAVRTRSIRLAARALILPLHDPVRIAEDAAVVDVLSNGRLELVVAGGYVPAEYQMFGKEFRDRPRLVEEGIAALKAAWSGEPFVYHGRHVHVALRPARQPRPPIVLGGSSAVAARRAARLCDGFEPTRASLFDVYLQECDRLGVVPGPPPPPMPRGRFLHVATDPERAWHELGPHLMHETNSYGKWLAAAGTGTEYRQVSNLDELRATGAYQIVTPAECLQLARSVGPSGLIEFHPLVGGADPSIGWASLHLFESEVLPKLRALGLVAGSEKGETENVVRRA
jgi:alkanesulfonate monooxygenase SsuD/methylene tetrahydromethanopterin reductase-like flavin-dependent oxidoreductase (luciferase family)